MEQYRKKLSALHEKVTHKVYVENMLKQLKVEKSSLEKKEKFLAEARLKEQADVDKLEGISLPSLLYSITGQKEEHIAKETQEARIAATKHEKVCTQLRLVNQEIEKYNYELIELSAFEKEYEQILNEKSEYIKKIDPANGAIILKLEEQLEFLKHQYKEIREAYAVGNAILEQIEEVAVSLDKAGDWGTFDLFGGGLFSDMMKHSHLDDAQMKINSLQELLAKYKTELNDVKIQLEKQVNIDGFLLFADFFFDGLFADWAVLSQIEDSEKQIRETNKQVQQIQENLAKMKNDMQTKIKEIQEEWNQKVLSV